MYNLNNIKYKQIVSLFLILSIIACFFNACKHDNKQKVEYKISLTLHIADETKKTASIKFTEKDFFKMQESLEIKEGLNFFVVSNLIVGYVMGEEAGVFDKKYQMEIIQLYWGPILKNLKNEYGTINLIHIDKIEKISKNS